MRYADLQEASDRLAIPMDRWLEASGNEVLRDEVGTFKLANFDARVNFQTGEILETGLTYWAAHTHQGLKYGMAASREDATEAARKALLEAYNFKR